MKSTVLIIPAALVTQARAVADWMGWGSGNYSVELTNDGTTVTHYGLHTPTSDQFEGWIKGTEPLPDMSIEGDDTGYNAITKNLIDNLIASFRTDVKNREHFDAVLEANGLAPMPEETAEWP